MAKNKVSEWSATASNNTDISGINIAEGCAPSGINNAIRELMAQLKDMQSGTDGDNFTVGGNLSVTGTSTFSDDIILGGSSGTSGQVLVSQGSGSAPAWGNAFVTGMIMMWSGTIATIPSGWLLCNGSSGTPDLRNRFIIGAHSDDAGVAKTTVTGSATQTGGSKDAINVSHTHTATVTDPGHSHTLRTGEGFGGPITSAQYTYSKTGDSPVINSNTTGITVSNSTEGSSGTNANLPPYYALAYIMKS
jgi:hypothetical protein